MNEDEICAGLAVTPGYRYAQRTGNILHVAGQVPHNGDGDLVGAGDAMEQATQCLRNLKLLVDLHGFGESDIRKLVVYVAGGPEELNSAWLGVVGWFTESVPPATLLGVALLGYAGQIVEIDATIVSAVEKDTPSVVV